MSVIDDVSFSIEDGEIRALVGPNGAGKSTLIHIVTGLTRADSGSVLVDGTAITVGGHTGLGFCPDDLPMPDLLTGNEYLDLAEMLVGSTVGANHRERLLECLRLDQAADRLIAAFSHGMKRKLQLLAALLRGPSVLILDEPLRGLDPESSALLKTLIRRFAADGGTVLLSTHDLGAADDLADTVLVLSGGRVVADSRVSELRDSDGSVEAAFLELTGLDRVVSQNSESFMTALARAERSRR